MCFCCKYLLTMWLVLVGGRNIPVIDNNLYSVACVSILQGWELYVDGYKYACFESINRKVFCEVSVFAAPIIQPKSGRNQHPTERLATPALKFPKIRVFISVRSHPCPYIVCSNIALRPLHCGVSIASIDNMMTFKKYFACHFCVGRKCMKWGSSSLK